MGCQPDYAGCWWSGKKASMWVTWKSNLKWHWQGIIMLSCWCSWVCREVVCEWHCPSTRHRDERQRDVPAEFNGAQSLWQHKKPKQWCHDQWQVWSDSHLHALPRCRVLEPRRMTKHGVRLWKRLSPSKIMWVEARTTMDHTTGAWILVGKRILEGVMYGYTHSKQTQWENTRKRQMEGWKVRQNQWKNSG